MTAPTPRFLSKLPQRPAGLQAYALAAAAVGAVAMIGQPLLGQLDLANIAMLFPLAVLFAAVRLGRGPAVLAAFLSVALFDFFFVHPQHTLVVSDLQYVLTFAVLLAVAMITAELASSLRSQRDAADQREAHTRALYEMARELSAALTTEQIGEIAAQRVGTAFDVRTSLLLPGPAGHLVPIGTTGVDNATLANAQRTLNGAGRLDADATVCLPLKAPMRTRGVLVIEPAQGALALSTEQIQLLETFGTLIAIALERVHYIDVAQRTQIEMASERLRNSLLAALSHDLRTPLTGLVGLADTLALTAPPLPEKQAELVEGIREEALRTSAQVNNLLDMARLQSGGLQLRREWQPLEEVVGSALRARARQLGAHTLTVRLPAELPLVDIDAVLMERVFCNLFENAAKYSPPGSHIGISAHTLDASVEIVIADDGPGLPAGRERAIFGKFSRGHSESGIPGVGLGLAIVEAIVEAHGGTVRGENAPGGGARFIIELPRGEPPALPEPDA
jgi:two-component system sensor histidine kinase KdpD